MSGYSSPSSGEPSPSGPYIPGNPYQIGEPCCEDRVCNCLGASLATIAAETARIANALEKKAEKTCDDILQCMDEIEKEIRKRLQASTASCDECKRMAEQGLSGTIEFAVQCANACATETAKVCSMGSPETWGKPCNECGEECCECKQGICTPVECPDKKEEDKQTTFVGWCNALTGSIAVTKQGELPPGDGFVQVSLGRDEQAAALEASRNCNPQRTAPQFVPNIRPTTTGGVLCDLGKYADGSALGILTQGGAAVNMADAARQAASGLLSFGLDGININNIGDLFYGIARTFIGGPSYYNAELMPTIASALNCPSTAWRDGVTMLGQIQAIGKLMGVDFSEFTTQLHYALNVNCRQKFLDPDKAIAAYLSNAINFDTVDTYWGVQGLCRESLTQYIHAAKAKPVPLQLAFMRRRKMINSNQYAEGMRELGYLDTGTSERLFNLTEQVPTLTDITRLMVRDADDESLVARLNLDAFFDQKYGRQLREWSEAQGVPEKFARYYWRAHWNIPSPTQLFTFYHRLRDDPRFGGEPKLLDDIKAALVQQDILPYWHDYYLATSFHPIGRIDIRRAYNIGAMTDDELAPAYRQLGYSNETSDTLSKFTKRLRDAALPNHRAIKLWIKGTLTAQEAMQRLQDDGIPQDKAQAAMRDAESAFASGPIAAAYVKAYLSRDTFIDLLTAKGVSGVGASSIADTLSLKRIDALPINDYIAGAIDRSEVESAMSDDGLHPDIAAHLLDKADRAVNNAFLVTCQKGIKRRFLYGELDTDEARNELITRGTTNARANQLVDWWGCERTASSKAISASKLCHWLSLGAITATDFMRRLKKLGYKDDDASLMVEDCLAGISAKRAAEARKDAKDELAQSRRAQQAARRQAAEFQRLAAQQARAAAQAKATRLAREKQLLSASQKIAVKCDCELVEALHVAKDAYSRLQREYALSPDETLQAMILAAEEWQGGAIADFVPVLNAFAEQAAGVESAAAPA